MYAQDLLNVQSEESVKHPVQTVLPPTTPPASLDSHLPPFKLGDYNLQSIAPVAP